MNDELLRMLIAQFHVLLIWTIAREKEGRGYLELPLEKRQAIEEDTAAMVTYYFRHWTAERIRNMEGPLEPPKVH